MSKISNPSASNLFIPSPQKSIINYETSSYVVSLYCGTGREGVLNSDFENSEFNHPINLLCLPDGKILVSDHSNNKLRILDVKTQQVSDFCTNARLLKPTGLCLWNQDTILVCDTGHNRIKQISLQSPNKCSYFAGCGKKGSKDGKLKECEFNKPKDICIASDGSIIVADSGNHRLRRIIPSLNRVQTINKGAPGYKDGDVKDVQFKHPIGLHLDFDGGILVCDSKNNGIRKLSKDFSSVFTVAGGSMNKGVLIDGSCTDCSFNFPTSITLSSNGDIYVVDTGNNCIRKISGGIVSTFAGGSERSKNDTILSMKGNAGFRDGPVSHSIFNAPKGLICLRDEGHDIIIVSDSNNNVLRILYPSEDEILASTLISDKQSSPSKSHSKKSKIISSIYSSSGATSPTQRSFTTEQRPSRDSISDFDGNNSFDNLTNTNTSLSQANENRIIYSAQFSPEEKENNDSSYTFYELIYQHEDDLSRIFAFYSNANSAKYESSNLSAVKFMRFVKDCKLLDEQKLNSSHIFIIFYEVTKHNNMRMSFNDFVNGLCLLSQKKFSPSQKSSLLNTSSLGTTDDSQVKHFLRMLLYQYVLPNARRSSLDPTMEQLSDQEVYSIWNKHENALYKIFSHYASSTYTPHEKKSWKNTQKALHTLNIEEFYKFCKDFDIFPQFMSKQKLTTIFRSSVARSHHFDYDPRDEDDSNITDGKNPSTDPVVNLDFYCFLECLGRIAVTRYSGDDLDKSYPTTAVKIEALLEHMHLSQGREQFASTMGSRLFKGLNSPRQKELFNELKNKPQKSDPDAYKLNYTKFSQKKKQKEGRFAGILKSATQTSRLFENIASHPPISESSSIEENGSYLQNHLTKKDRDIQYKSTSMERILCTAENVILFIFDKKRKYWKYLCTGAVKIVNNPSFLIPLKRPFLLRFIEKETGTELANIISIENLPYVDHEELFHIWKKSGNSKQKYGGLFPDGRIYGIQFPNIESSKAFENQYAKITEFELISNGNDSKKIIRYDFLNLSRKSKSLRSSKLNESFNSFQQLSKQDLTNNSLSGSGKFQQTQKSQQSPNHTTKSHSPLTKSMLLSPKIAFTPTRKLSKEDESFINSSTISNMPNLLASSPQNDTQFGSEEARDAIAQDIPSLKSSTHASPMSKNVDIQDVLQYERTLNKLVTDYFSVYNNDQISSEEISREIKRRIKWATGLQISQANDLFQEDFSPQSNAEEEESFNLLDSRRENVAQNLLKLENSICGNFSTLQQYHNTICRSLPKDTLLIECYLKDSLGMKMFTHMPLESFSAVLGDIGQLTIHLLDNGDLASSREAIREIIRANVVLISTQTNRRIVHQDVSLNFDESKPSTYLTVPFVVSKEDFSTNDDDAILCLQDFQPMAGPIYECSYRVEIELLVKNFGLTKRRLFSFNLNIGTFTDRTNMDLVYVSMKEHGIDLHPGLPGALRPLSLFAYRELSRFE